MCHPMSAHLLIVTVPDLPQVVSLLYSRLTDALRIFNTTRHQANKATGKHVYIKRSGRVDAGANVINFSGDSPPGSEGDKVGIVEQIFQVPFPKIDFLFQFSSLG